MLVWRACDAEPIFVYAACMQYGCIVCAAHMQHTCVTCVGVHVCAVYMPNKCSEVADIYAVCMQLYVCSMYAVYMLNMSMKVADIYAVGMQYMYACCIVHICILHTSCACMWHVSIFVYAAHMKTWY